MPASAASREVARHVAQGIREHQAGRFDAAAKAFADAEKILPDDPRVAFNRACALSANGQTEEAEELFQRAVLAPDLALAGSAHYNLGGLAAQAAKAVFGEQPEEALPDTRVEGLELMTRAVQHYRNCLRVQPDHKAARHNLELLRLWIKQMEDIWARRDRERRREETGLLEFLEILWQQQRLLRATTGLLAKEEDSPQHRRAVITAQKSQQELLEEIGPLREKLENEFAKANSDGNADQLSQVREALSAMVERIRAAMSRANGDLAVRDPTSASQAQAEALVGLDEIYRAIAPLEAVLSKATQFQERLVQHSKPRADPDDGVAQPTSSVSEMLEPAEEQQLVAGWAAVLAPKADSGLRALASSVPGPQPQPQPQPSASQPEEEQDEAAQAEVAARRAAFEKAIEFGPQVEDLANSAVGDLRMQNWRDALPKQEEALRLLKEISAELPKQQNEQDQDQDQDQDQEQDQDQDQDQQNQDPQKDGQQEQQSQDSDPEKDQESNEQDQDKPDPQSKQKLSQQQAEQLLRQVRQREREHRDRQKELRRYLRSSVKVDKDW